MKNYILFFSFLLLLVLSCNEGIDPITEVAPGPDQNSPQITISFPVDGTVLKVLEVVTSINVKFEVTDDIEIGSVSVTLDGSEIQSFTEFTDYRRFLAEFDYDNITDGVHTLTVTATDLDGKTSSSSVSFEKEPPYVPVYDGEILYMNFDNDIIDLVNIQRPTIVGSPTFAGESLAGLNAIMGATDSYLTIPTSVIAGTDGVMASSFSAIFWMKVNSTPDRAGILVMGPPDDANPDAQNNRKSGFRFFRENAGGNQRFKLNVGRGEGDSWFDGGTNADVAPNTDSWTHLAFTISNNKCVVYINGEIAREGDFTGIDWTGCDVLSIMSGAPRFAGWNHKSDLSIMDELRLFNRELTQSEIRDIIFDESGMVGGYSPKYAGETFYMPFDGDYTEQVSRTGATAVGTIGFAGDSKVGDNAIAGAEDSYLTFPTDGLLGEEFSAAFWMNINALPDRAGILVVGPPEPDKEPDAQNNRTSGFRFFRENAGGMQRFKLNVGNGTADTWFDGGASADVDPTTGDWVHFAFTISSSEAVVYINGEIAKQADYTGVDWTGCDVLSIMSGGTRFNGWGHKSDLSYMDELRLFNKALSQAEIQTIINDEN